MMMIEQLNKPEQSEEYNILAKILLCKTAGQADHKMPDKSAVMREIGLLRRFLFYNIPMTRNTQPTLSPFTWRYGSQPMRQIWSEVHKRLLLAQAMGDPGRGAG